MITAVVKNNIVENLIVINEAQIPEMEKALDCELVDARPYGLAVGDMRTPRGWTRNGGGEQIVLEELEPKQYDGYTLMYNRAQEAEAAIPVAQEIATAQATAIVMGTLEDESKPALMAVRVTLDTLVDKIADNPVEINENVVAIRAWMPGKYEVGDIRVYEDIPYRCVQAHDSTDNNAWNPKEAVSLWAQYHGTTKESAREWIQPTGAHDQYKAGEWMVYNGRVYECKIDTTYTPNDYPSAWALR